MLLINPMKTVFVYGRRGRWGHWTAKAMINHTDNQAFHCRLKRHPRPRGPLEEKEGKNLAGEHIALVVVRVGLQIRCKVENRVDLLHGDGVPLHEHDWYVCEGDIELISKLFIRPLTIAL